MHHNPSPFDHKIVCVCQPLPWHEVFHIAAVLKKLLLIIIMNLFYDSSASALHDLVASADSKLFVHNIAVDYDGEVIIDPELHYPHVDLDRYKFCIQVRKASLHNLRKLQTLYQALLSTFKFAPISVTLELRAAA